MEQALRDAVRRIFTTLKITFPAWYEKHYGEARAEQLARRVWRETISDLNDVAVDRGLHRMAKECKFPPSPSDFLELCRRVDDMPTVQEAWQEALMGKYTHEAVRVAAESTGTFDLRTATGSEKSLFQRFERNYAIVQRRAQNAQPLDGKIAQGIEHDSGFKAQLAKSHQEARDLVTAQNIPTDGKAARALLLAKLGIRRERHA
ncbi:replication protein P [Pseudomonas sp. NBRC 111136]|uniref:replication protein P n=1 Tax=Pseudomonas sp. NBRC 111136 TaxID=1661051 RepID=UPI000761CFC3|nr:replication protein P [Pseudomonas sp. NBRC 111136]